MRIRKAVPADAPALKILNDEFNGEGTAAAHIEASLREGREIVCIAETDSGPAGFLCAQVVWSMCYHEPVGEITELYVREAHRRKGAATGLMQLAQRLCLERGARELKLLTGGDNFAAQAFYESLGYARSGEIHYEKEIQP